MRCLNVSTSVLVGPLSPITMAADARPQLDVEALVVRNCQGVETLLNWLAQTFELTVSRLFVAGSRALAGVQWNAFALR